MDKRLQSSDVELLAQESSAVPLHNLTLDIFEPGPEGLTYEKLRDHIADRISFVPRYRQRVRRVPGQLAPPVWVDDADFDLSFHVRRSALARPGSMDQLRELVARTAARQLDPQRPLWEVYFVEGLTGDRCAVLTKSHQILVDGITTVDLGQVLLDIDAGPRHVVADAWEPTQEPSTAGLMLDAVADTVRSPVRIAQQGRSIASSMWRVAEAVFEQISQTAETLASGRRGSDSPFNIEPTGQRRIVFVETDLKDYRKIRRAHGTSVNDVILATLTGAIRSWLMTRAEPVHPGRRLIALVPMSVIDEELEPTSLGSQVIGHRLDLPIGENSPVVRLHQVSYAFKDHSETGRAVAADQIAGVAGFAPTTFHALGSRVAFAEAAGANIVITNVPGPQFPMFLAGARMEKSFPIPPLQSGFGAAIAVTSYNGGVYYGITADRDAFPDAEVLGQCVVEALEELVDATSTQRLAPRGRQQ